MKKWILLFLLSIPIVLANDPATYVDSTEAISAGETTSITISLPSGVQADDLLIAIVAISEQEDTGTGIVTPTGWTVVASEAAASAVSQPNATVYRRIANGTDDSTFTFTNGGTSTGILAHLLAYRGVNNLTGDPITQINSTDGGGATGCPTAPSVTTIGSNETILYIGFMDDDEIPGTEGNFYPAGTTGREATETTSGGNGLGLGTAEDLQIIEGTTGAGQFQNCQASEEWGGITLAIFPDPDPNPPAIFDPKPIAESDVNATSPIVISANATDNVAIESVKAKITGPNSVTSTLNLVNTGGDLFTSNFTQANLFGLYQVNITVNDTSGNTNTTTTNFTRSIVDPTNFLDLVDENLAIITSSIIIDQNNSGLLDLNISDFGKDPIIDIQIFDYQPDSPLGTLRFGNFTNDRQFINRYFVDPEFLNATSVNLTITASGTAVRKCNDFDVLALTCNSLYEPLITGLAPGATYTVSVNSTDPAFGETNITGIRQIIRGRGSTGTTRTTNVNFTQVTGAQSLLDTSLAFHFVSYRHSNAADTHAATFKSSYLNSTDTLIVQATDDGGTTPNDVFFEYTIVEFLQGSPINTQTVSADISTANPAFAAIIPINLTQSFILSHGHNHDAVETTTGCEEYVRVNLVNNTAAQWLAECLPDNGPEFDRAEVIQIDDNAFLQDVQRGLAFIPTTAENVTVVPARPIERNHTLLFVSVTSNPPDADVFSHPPNLLGLYATILPNNTILISRNTAATSNLNISWELVEFQPNTADVQHLTYAIAGGSGGANQSIIPVAENKSAAFGTVVTPFGFGGARSTDTTAGATASHMFAIQFINKTLVEATRGGTTGSALLGVQVISFADEEPPILDNETPTAGTLFNSSVENITLTVNATDNKGVSAVQANITFPNGTTVTFNMFNTSPLRFNVTLVSQTIGRYNVTFIGNDTSNNFGFAFTHFFIDDRPPNVTQVSANPQQVAANTQVNISANVTDDIAVDNVFANITQPDGTVEQLTLTSGSLFSGLYSNTSQVGQYTVLIIANDTPGRINDTETTSFVVVDLSVNLSAPALDLNIFPFENFTMSCNATVNISSVNNTQLIPQFKNNSNFIQIPTISTQTLEANESTFQCQNLTPTDNSCFHSWNITARTAADNLELRCLVSSDQTNATSEIRLIDIINISISLDDNEKFAGESSIASMRTNIISSPFNVTWLNSTGQTVTGCSFTGTTPAVAFQTFLASCSLPSDTPQQSNLTAFIHVNNDPLRNASRDLSVINPGPLDYAVTDLSLTSTQVFLQTTQAIRAIVLDNESSPAINECCKIHIDDPNTNAPIITSDVLTIDGEGECRGEFLLDFITFEAPQDYQIDVDAWQCSDEDLPSNQRKRGVGSSSFSIIEHATNNDALLPLKTNETQFAGLTTVRIIHNRTNNFGDPMEVNVKFVIANNITEEDFVFDQFQDLPFSLNVGTSAVEYGLPLPGTLTSGLYRIEVTIEYLVDNIIREIDIVKSDSFTISGLNDTVLFSDIFVQNMDSNRTNESLLPGFGGSVERPRLFLTAGLPFFLCVNITNTYSGPVDVQVSDIKLQNSDLGKFFDVPFTDFTNFGLQPGQRTVCANDILPQLAQKDDSWQISATGSIGGGAVSGTTPTRFFYVDEIDSTFFSPKFHIFPNSTFSGLPGVFVRNEFFQDVPMLDDPEIKSQSEIPFGASESCTNRENGSVYTCDYSTFLTVGRPFQICFVMENVLDSTQTLFIERITMEDDLTGTTIDFDEFLTRDGEPVGIANEVESKFDIATQTSSLFGLEIPGFDVFCSNTLRLPDSVPGSNSWDIQGVFSVGVNRETLWNFESEEFTINGLPNSATIINFTSIIFDKELYVPGEIINVSINATTFLATPLFNLPIELNIQSASNVTIDVSEFILDVAPGNNSAKFAIEIPSNIQDFDQPYSVELFVPNVDFTVRTSSEIFGSTFNVTNLLDVNTITDKESYFVGDNLLICANVTNNFGKRVSFDILYNYRCGVDTSTGRTLLGSFEETRAITGLITQNQCHSFQIPSVSELNLGIQECSASTQVRARNSFTGIEINTISPAFNITNPVITDRGWDLINQDFIASFNVSGPEANFDINIPLPEALKNNVNSINATFNGSNVEVTLRVNTDNTKTIHFENLSLGETIQKLNITVSSEFRLDHNITSSLITFEINETTPLNITYNITLASGEGFSIGQKRGVVFIYEFITMNGSGTLVDQNDFDGIVTPLIVETTVTVGTPTTITTSLLPKLQPGVHMIIERIRLKDKEDVVFSS